MVKSITFFDGKSALISLLEWTAIQKITFKGDVQKMAEQFPEHLKAQASWVKTFNQDARQTHRDIYADIITGKISTIARILCAYRQAGDITHNSESS